MPLPQKEKHENFNHHEADLFYVLHELSLVGKTLSHLACSWFHAAKLGHLVFFNSNKSFVHTRPASKRQLQLLISFKKRRVLAVERVAPVCHEAKNKLNLLL